MRFSDQLWPYALVGQDPLDFPQTPFIHKSENILTRAPQETPSAVDSSLIATSVMNECSWFIYTIQQDTQSVSVSEFIQTLC